MRYLLAIVLLVVQVPKVSAQESFSVILSAEAFPKNEVALTWMPNKVGTVDGVTTVCMSESFKLKGVGPGRLIIPRPAEKTTYTVTCTRGIEKASASVVVEADGD